MPSIELYTQKLPQIQTLLEEVFGYAVIYTHGENFKRMSHPITQDEIMLFDYTAGNHIAPFDGDVFAKPRGTGLEICLRVADFLHIHKELKNKKMIWTSEITEKSWGTKEFYFRLEEGYLFRIINET